MDYNKLKSILIKSNLKVTVIGIIILGMGFAIASTPFFGGKGNVPIAVIFGGIFIVLGILALRVSLPNLLEAKSETHPLLRAINSGQKDFLIWVFVKEIHVKAEHGGTTLGTSNTLIYFDKDCKGKGVELVVSKKDNVMSLYEYLIQHFDVPYKGYNESNRDAVNDLFGNKGWKKVL